MPSWARPATTAASTRPAAADVTILVATRRSANQFMPSSIDRSRRAAPRNGKIELGRHYRPSSRVLQVGDVGLLGPYRLGRLLERGQFAVGQRGLDHPPHAGRAQLGEHAEVDAGDPVL